MFWAHFITMSTYLQSICTIFISSLCYFKNTVFVSSGLIPEWIPHDISKVDFLMHKSDHVSPLKSWPWSSTLGLTSCPLTFMYPLTIQSFLLQVLPIPLYLATCSSFYFKYHFLPPLLLHTHTLVLLPHFQGNMQTFLPGETSSS